MEDQNPFRWPASEFALKVRSAITFLLKEGQLEHASAVEEVWDDMITYGKAFKECSAELDEIKSLRARLEFLTRPEDCC